MTRHSLAATHDIALKGMQLIRAAGAGDSEVIRALLKDGISPNVSSNGVTPLSFAVARADIGMAALLLDHGADVHATVCDDYDEVRPLLSTAAQTGCVDMARLLLDRGAAIDARSSQGATPLMHAAYEGQKDMVVFLLSRGANPLAVCDAGMTVEMLAATTDIEHIASAAMARARADIQPPPRFDMTKFRNGAKR